MEASAEIQSIEDEQDKTTRDLVAYAWLSSMDIQKKPEYSEALEISRDGRVNSQRRLVDALPPFLTTLCNLETVDDMYKLLKTIQDENPNLDISVTTDPKERRWVKYSVKRKAD